MTSAMEPKAAAAFEEVPTADLVREAFDEAKELVRLEVQLAKDDAKIELKHLKESAILFGIAGGVAFMGLTMLAVALVLALGGTAFVALAVAGGFLVIAAILAFVGKGLIPKAPLERTRNRISSDVKQLKEHIV